MTILVNKLHACLKRLQGFTFVVTVRQSRLVSDPVFTESQVFCTVGKNDLFDLRFLML